MSNILIIKHGSLGDIAQISGAIQDIKENHSKDKIFFLTTEPYVNLLKKCPYLDEILVDKRLSRLNLIYLIKLKQMLDSYNFNKAYDLQNSSRTSFYRKFIFKKVKYSSTETTLPDGTQKRDFDNEAVLERFNHQLKKSNINTRHTLFPNFSWACENIDNLKNEYNLKKYILIFPFCSINLPHKKWPYYNELINLIKKNYPNLNILIAPGPNEIKNSKNFNAQTILHNQMALTIIQLASLIKESSFVIANDTGPAHMAAHLGCKGVTLFGYHTSPEKVSIETSNFKAIVKNNLKDLTAEEVYKIISNQLNSI